MQPATAQDFLKVSLQRLTAAEQIMDVLLLTLEAQYIGGYSVEFSFKAAYPGKDSRSRSTGNARSIDARSYIS